MALIGCFQTGCLASGYTRTDSGTVGPLSFSADGGKIQATGSAVVGGSLIKPLKFYLKQPIILEVVLKAIPVRSMILRVTSRAKLKRPDGTI
jgi:hypothetical protein